MQFADLLASQRKRVDQVLLQLLSTQSSVDDTLRQAMQYGALLGGKRLRPFLVYATGIMLEADSQALDAPAAAIECVHAYSLIHDDLPAMDNDSLRRGQPTCHIRYGEDCAILAGDALQTLAFSILSTQPMPGVSAADRLAMVAELAGASGAAGMCGGQALDLAAEGKQIDLAALERIHRHKTGALIRAAVRMGAYCAGERGRQALPLLDRYAEAIGLAFQVQDDILDVVGDTATLGKQQGADQVLDKSTYPALMGLDNARHKAQELYQQSLDALSPLGESYDISVLQSLANYVIERDN
ncbi:MAG: Farnesyl diphosphate synthase [Candidatus Erwinia impunctatus]|nr:Farnesyl diphosphate synthase [Culicoides impunctatus]